MTLDEAIRHCNEVAEENEKQSEFDTDCERYKMSDYERIQYKECANEHRQLAEWLKDYKRLLEQEPCEDCISRQAALDAFGLSEKTRKYGGDHSGYDTIMLYEVQDALEALPSIQPQPKTEPCEDAVSRQEVLKALEKEIPIGFGDDATSGYIDGLARASEVIENSPSATPAPKTGRWIIIDDCEKFIAKCSECGQIEDSRMIGKYAYCHCGAKMESEG